MKKIITMGIVLLSIYNASAQGYTSVQYTIGLPTSDLSEFIDDASFRGATVDYKGVVFPNVSAGISVGWNVFYQRSDYQTYTDDNTSMSGIQYRYTNSVPILVTGDYFFSVGDFRPYLGVGVGTVWSEKTIDIGLYRMKEDAWHFAVAPEVGLMYDIRPGVGINVSARYNAAFKTDDMNSVSYVGLNVGLVFFKAEL